MGFEGGRKAGRGSAFRLSHLLFPAAPHPSPGTGQRCARSQNALHGSAQTRADFCAPCAAVSRSSPLGFSSPHPHEVEHVPALPLDILCPPPCSRTTRSSSVDPHLVRPSCCPATARAHSAFFRPYLESRAFSAHHQFANDTLTIQKLLTMRRALHARLDRQLARTRPFSGHTQPRPQTSTMSCKGRTCSEIHSAVRPRLGCS